MTGVGVRVLFDRPCIPPNTGNAIRMAAGAGCELHLAGPLGFDLSAPQLRRAGLDYHDLAHVEVHEDLEAAYAVGHAHALAAQSESGSAALLNN